MALEIAAGTRLDRKRCRSLVPFAQFPREQSRDCVTVYTLEPAPSLAPAPLAVALSGAVEADDDTEGRRHTPFWWQGLEGPPPHKRLFRLRDAAYLGHGVVLAQDRSWREFSFPRYARPSRGAGFHREGHEMVFDQAVRLDRRIDEPLVCLGDAPEQFGHFLLETVPRLWARDLASSLGRRLCVLRGEAFSPWQARLLELAGIDPGDIVRIGAPAILADVVQPAPLHELHQRTHPQLQPLTGAMVEAARVRSAAKPAPRLYLTRRHAAKRALINEDEVIAVFERRGFVIVAPERLPVEDQLVLAASAERLAGPSGSQMHLSMFQPSGRGPFVIAPRLFAVADDAAMAAERGGRAHYHLCRGAPGDDRHPTKRAYAADLPSLAAALDAWLAG
jgi:capsular polysaccharide biosynthesis protein